MIDDRCDNFVVPSLVSNQPLWTLDLSVKVQSIGVLRTRHASIRIVNRCSVGSLRLRAFVPYWASFTGHNNK